LCICNNLAATNELKEIETYGEIPLPRSHHSTVIHSNLFLVFGGKNGNTIFNDLHALRLGTYAANSLQVV